MYSYGGSEITQDYEPSTPLQVPPPVPQPVQQEEEVEDPHPPVRPYFDKPEQPKQPGVTKNEYNYGGKTTYSYGGSELTQDYDPL